MRHSPYLAKVPKNIRQGIVEGCCSGVVHEGNLVEENLSFPPNMLAWTHQQSVCNAVDPAIKKSHLLQKDGSLFERRTATVKNDPYASLI